MLNRLFPFAADLWKHRELLWQFTLRNVELRHKGSHLGLIWSFLNPLLMLALYVLVFGYIFGSKFGVLPGETRADYALGVFLGLTVFHFVAEVLGVSPSFIVGNPNFVKKVVFPLEVLPAAGVGAATFHFLVSLILVLLSVMLFGSGLPLSSFWLPVVLLPIVLFCLGISWLISALGVFFRDVGQLMGFLSVATMFASAVFYSAKIIPPAIWFWMRLNPVLLAIEMARAVTLWRQPLNFHHLIYLYVCSVATCWLGHAAFRRMKPAFADVI